MVQQGETESIEPVSKDYMRTYLCIHFLKSSTFQLDDDMNSSKTFTERFSSFNDLVAYVSVVRSTSFSVIYWFTFRNWTESFIILWVIFCMGTSFNLNAIGGQFCVILNNVYNLLHFFFASIDGNETNT